jgi:hypothetical protein
MKTKIVFAQIALLILAVTNFTGCSNNNNELKHLDVSAVKTLYDPDNGKSVKLQPSASATLYFDWEQAKAADNGIVFYDVVFDTLGGNFSKPIYRVPADNSGMSNGATITHKILNKVASMAHIGSAQTGSVIWSVVSTKGLNDIHADVFRKLTITRLPGFDVIPDSVYLTGSATEGGTSIASAVQTLKTANGEFEVFTQLTAGTYKLISSKKGIMRTFAIKDGSLIEKDSTITVSSTDAGIYKINYDFNLGSVAFTKISKMEFDFCPTPKFEVMTYSGLGTWKLLNRKLTQGTGDSRYRFRATLSDGSYYFLASVNFNNNDAPLNYTGTYQYVYWYGIDVVTDQWCHSYKFLSADGLKTVNITLMLQANLPQYTHLVQVL